MKKTLFCLLAACAVWCLADSASDIQTLDGAQRQRLADIISSGSVDLTGTTDGGGTGILTNMADVHATIFHGDGSALTGISGGQVFTNANNIVYSTNAFTKPMYIGTNALNIVDSAGRHYPLVVPQNADNVSAWFPGGIAYVGLGGTPTTQIPWFVFNVNGTASHIYHLQNSGALTFHWGTGGTEKFSMTTGGLVIGASGSAISKSVTTAISTNFGTVNAGASATIATPLTGATENCALAMRLPSAVSNQVIWTMVCTNGTLFMNAFNPTAANIDLSTQDTYGATAFNP